MNIHDCLIFQVKPGGSECQMVFNYGVNVHLLLLLELGFQGVSCRFYAFTVSESL